jgi:S-adenosylmethionine-dependent methyltransferase
MRNLWVDNASTLAEAYTRSDNSIRFKLATRALLSRISPPECKVVDIGGGGSGQQAILLARAGHRVTIVDVDPAMLELARKRVSYESAEVSSRIELVQGEGQAADERLGRSFDLACCHSVIMYQEDPEPLLRSLIRLVRLGGTISVISVNPEAIAMRSGLQGRWLDTVATLEAGENKDSLCLPSYAHGRHKISRVLEESGAEIKQWYGLGIFTDHLTGKILADDPEQVYLAEWLAGERDPYRGVARAFHVLAERNR